MGTSLFRTHCSSMRTHFLPVLFLVLPLLPWAGCSADDAIGLLDTDKNGVLDIEEVETAATKLFSGLDRDKSDTLDATELSGRLDAAAIRNRDPDNDGTLDHNEYAK